MNFTNLKDLSSSFLFNTPFYKFTEEGKPSASVASSEQAPVEEVQESKIPERRKSTTPLNSPTIAVMNKPWLSETGNESHVDWKVCARDK